MSLMLAERNETIEPAEMLIDFIAGTWTCSIHGNVMKLDSGHNCADCEAEVHPPPLPAALLLAADNLIG